MIATTLYIPKDLYRRVGELARIEKKPKAQLVREFVETGVSQKQFKTGATAQFFKSLSDLGIKGGPKDLSLNHDRYTWE